ncbi:aminotransferase class V-fold PLP-dependent enzyme [Rhodohalobacter sp. SW132]|uniref:aminotransferase class V-fold PLP-dependent enzyme n=1 Tax=Rhodohalobacter sp. SW132 TaxID=2293433 RepID=UPI000E23CA2C|nr:aminotransferase class V-fold PLP-dependent enzyme [Rhodohalobacter sp. SW132]REL33540.1 aminotransferase class V-fold PLP-dependent enzyme [Rhodohalobacter sp. SW132]
MNNRPEELSAENLLQKWRDDTPGCQHRNHLNNAGAALMPQPVIDAVHEHLNLEARIGGYEAAELENDRTEKAYRSVADLIQTQPSNIAMVENATVATSQALSSFDFQRGDAILTTNVDYSSNQIMLLSLAKRFGVEIKRADDLSSGGVDAESVRKLIRKKRPKLVLMSWIPTNSGLVQDAQAVGEICRETEVTFVLDACQAVGQIPVDVETLNCDFLAATARKFLRGPRGIGFLYVSNRMLERGMEPLFPDTHGAAWTDPDQYTLEPDARRFENWEFSHALILGLGAAAEYAMEVGIDVAANRSFKLAEYMRSKLEDLPGARIFDRGENQCAIVSVGFDHHQPEKLVERLREEKINTSAASRTAGVIDMKSKGVDSILRISPHYYNTMDEADELLEALHRII